MQFSYLTYLSLYLTTLHSVLRDLLLSFSDILLSDILHWFLYIFLLWFSYIVLFQLSSPALNATKHEIAGLPLLTGIVKLPQWRQLFPALWPLTQTKFMEIGSVHPWICHWLPNFCCYQTLPLGDGYHRVQTICQGYMESNAHRPKPSTGRSQTKHVTSRPYCLVPMCIVLCILPFPSCFQC